MGKVTAVIFWWMTQLLKDLASSQPLIQQIPQVLKLKKSRVFGLTKAKASWFYSLYPDLLVVFGELVMVFEKLEGVFEERNKFLTIWILNLKIICEYL